MLRLWVPEPHLELQEARELDITVHLGGREEMLKGKLRPGRHNSHPDLGLSRGVGSQRWPSENSRARALQLWEVGPVLIVCKLPHWVSALAPSPMSPSVQWAS